MDAQVYGNLISTSAANPLAFAIGQFLVNCGMLEFETYVWILGFGASDPANKEKCKRELFNDRKQRLLRIVEQLPVLDEAKAAVRQVWDETAKIMEFRNVIAHNPVVVQYNGPDANLEWFIRVIDANTLVLGNLKEYVQADIDGMTDLAHGISKRILNLREAIGGMVGAL
jgi:hypothetical protein